jgi:hypothetical protein
VGERRFAALEQLRLRLAVALLVAVGGVQLVTDALFSVRGGDWKKFLRERRLARELVRS